MRMFRIVWFLFLLFISKASAQKLGSALTVGVKVPDVKFDTILHYKSNTSSLSEFRGQIVVLDFWSRGCASCIASFPKIEDLNSRYKGNAIVIPVSRETHSEFQKIKKYSQILKEVKLPFYVGDTILHQYFPHKYVPYCVWLNREGEFIGTTVNVTSQMIDEALAGTRLIAEKLDTVKEIEPLDDFAQIKERLVRRQWNGHLYYSSFEKMAAVEVRGRDIRLFPVTKILTDNKSRKMIGLSRKTNLLSIISGAYNAKISDVQFQSEELEQLVPPKESEKLKIWVENNMFTYEYVEDPAIMDNSIPIATEFIKQDIRNEFGIVGGYQDVVRKCYVLTKLGKGSERERVVEASEESALERTKEGIYIKNYYTEVLAGLIANGLNRRRPLDYPIFNETGLNRIGELYLKIKDESSLIQWNQELKKYGYRVDLVERKLKTLILRIENKAAFSRI